MAEPVNCEKITYYIEKGYLTELNITEKIQIKLHQLYCKCCKNYEPDSLTLNKVFKLLAGENKVDELSKQEKEAIKTALERMD